MSINKEIYTSETGAKGFYYRSQKTILLTLDIESKLKPLTNTHKVVMDDGYEPVILPQEVVDYYQLPNSLGWRKK